MSSSTCTGKTLSNDFYNTPMPFPKHLPTGFNSTNSWDEESVKFDPKIHMQYEPPSFVVDLAFQKRQYPLNPKESYPGLAFTAPFRILSAEGVKVLRDIVDKHLENRMVKQSDSRTPHCLRGLGYVSRFVRDLNLSCEMIDLLGNFAKDKLAPHTMPMNYSQINVGKIGGDRPVDSWHIDSVDYVIVIILSDIRGMDGGRLEVVLHPTEKALELMELRKGNFNPGELMTLDYVEAGYCIFMQGSKMLHHVTPVKSAKEPRMTLINSYVSLDPFRPDTTKYQTFVEGDPKHVCPLEFARHKAWRVSGILKHLIEEVPFPPKDHSINGEMIDLLDKAAQELSRTRDIISGKTIDAVGFYDEVNKVKATSIVKSNKS